MRQRDDERRGNTDLSRSIRTRQMADERDARRCENTESRRSARVRQMTADRDAGAEVILSQGGLLELDRQLMRGTPGAARILSRRSARVRQMTADRDARRRGDTESRRPARAEQNADEREARRCRDAERRAATRDEASRPDRAHLRVHARPSHRTICLGAAHFCSHCRGRLLCGETESLCCGNGRITTTPLPTLPEGREEMFRTPAFRKHSRPGVSWHAESPTNTEAELPVFGDA